MKYISPTFLTRAAQLLADTTEGLKGSSIVKITVEFARQAGVPLESIRYNTYPFEGGAAKREALRENLNPFDPQIQYQIIDEVCEDLIPRSEQNREALIKLQNDLRRDYSYLSALADQTEIDQVLIENTKIWLQPYAEASNLYAQAISKYRRKASFRNMVDDLRLALEQLLKSLLNNGKSLENQKSDIGRLLKKKGTPPHLRNMFTTLLSYYGNYQNDHAKHNDAVNEEEIEFILELTSSFMKYLVRMSRKEVTDE